MAVSFAQNHFAIRRFKGWKNRFQLRAQNKEQLPFREIHSNTVENLSGRFSAVFRCEQPINRELLNKRDEKKAVQAIQKALNQLKLGQWAQIMVSSERMDLAEYIDHLGEQMQTSKNVRARTFFEETMDFLKGYGRNAQRVLHFYLVIQSPYTRMDRAMDHLNKLTKDLKATVRQGRMKLRRLTGEMIRRIYYEKLNPNTSQNQPYRSGMDLSLLAPASIKPEGDIIKADGMNYRFYTLTDVPENVDAGWLSEIIHYNADSDFSIFSEVVNKKQSLKATNDAIKEIEYRLGEKGLDPFTRIQYREQKKSLEKMLKRVHQQTENMNEVSFLISLRHHDREELDSISDDFESTVASNKMEARRIDFTWAGPPYDLLWTTIPCGYIDPGVHQKISWPMQSEALASTLPFDSSELNYNRGIIWGFNSNDTPLAYDDFDRDTFFNGNHCVFGMSGAGKSYFVRLKIWRKLNYWRINWDGHKIIVIDPEGEYGNIPGANEIRLHFNSGYTLNPFHLRSAILDESEEWDLGKYLPTKISQVITFLRWLLPDIDPYEKSILTQAIEQIYHDYGLTYDGYRYATQEKPLPDQFPTLSDLVKKLEEYSQTERMRYSLAPYASGPFSSLFNGQQSWDMDEPLTVFNIKSLTEEVRGAVMHLLIDSVWEQIKLKAGWIDFIVDEAHILADPERPDSLKFLRTMAKTIRKYGGNLTTVTQQISDFMSVGTLGQQIYDNAWFKTLLWMSASDMRALSSFEKFSEREKEILDGEGMTEEDKPKGDCIHMVNKQRIHMQIQALPFEKTALGLEEETA